MSQTQLFEIPARQRLIRFLEKKTADAAGGTKTFQIELLTPDASTRDYFRIDWKNSKAIACVYGEPFLEKEQSYLNVTKLFLAGNLPVAEIYDFDGELGIIVLEDFGDKILRSALLAANDDEAENLLNEAIIQIARIQAATPKAFAMNSIASRLKFDEEKLLWELNFFKTHYFESLNRKKLLPELDDSLTREFIEISRELESKARVLCHRDFHAANLMIDFQNRLRIIDHQDARIGTTSYDLVSLLLDRISAPPSNAWIREKRLFFLNEREKLGLETLDPDDFAYEFRLQTIQRCLKAIGTFSYQTAVRRKTNYTQYIEPMFQVVLQACRRLEKFPELQKVIEETLER